MCIQPELIHSVDELPYAPPCTSSVVKYESWKIQMITFTRKRRRLFDPLAMNQVSELVIQKFNLFNIQ
jgi:hypothetical protein